MTVVELIEALSKMNPDAQVLMDPCGEELPIVENVFPHTSHKTIVYLEPGPRV